MANYSQKKPFTKSMERWIKQKVADGFAKRGLALPASVVAISGSIVTVQFEANLKPLTLPNVTVPMMFCQYNRPPIQIGELGGVIPFDVLMGFVSGLGSPTPPTKQMPSNLGALVWVPVSSADWSAPDDPNAYCIYGPNGFRLRDTGNNCSIVSNTEDMTITGKNSITLKVGSMEIVITSSAITIDGTDWATHMHSAVQTGSSNSGPVV